MDYRQFQKYPSDLGARGLWHSNPFGAPKNSEGPEGDSDFPHQGLRQTAGANPIQSTWIFWETQNCHRFLGLGHLGFLTPQIHRQCTDLMEQRGRRPRTEASVLSHRKLLCISKAFKAKGRAVEMPTEHQHTEFLPKNNN